MPILIPKPRLDPVPVTAPAPAPVPSAPPGLSAADVERMLNARDDLWDRQIERLIQTQNKRIEELTATLLAAIPKPPEAAPRKPSKVLFEMDNRGNPIGFTITPEN